MSNPKPIISPTGIGEIKTLLQKSIHLRRIVMEIIYHAKAGHTGGSLSCVDVLNVLYNHAMNVNPANFHSPDRDRYIQSKGHAVEALYAVLADKGFFSPEDLRTLGEYRSPYIGHPTRKVAGIEQNTGALGHGLPIAVGTALAGKLDQRTYRVFTLLGDGELAEGSNWEAMMAAAHYKLDNLVIIIDRNSLQITGKTEEVMALEPLEEKLSSFGLAVRTIDGNDIAALVNTFDELPFETGKPNAVIAHTIKGKGISFIEGNHKWHHHVPSEDKFVQAMQELDAVEQEWRLKYG